YLLLLMKTKSINLLEGKDKTDLSADIEGTYKELIEELNSDLINFEKIDKEELTEVIDELKEDEHLKDIEKGFETLLYQSLISPGYSLYDLAVGYIAPHKSNFKRCYRSLDKIISKSEFYNLSVIFIKAMQDNLAFNGRLDASQRTDIMSQYRSSWGM